MHIHGSPVPFNVRSYPVAKQTSDATSNATAFALPQTGIAGVYSYASRQQNDPQNASSDEANASDDATGDGVSASSQSPVVSGSYNSGAALTNFKNPVGSLIDALA